MTATSESLPLELQILELFQSRRLVVVGPTDVQRLTGVSKGTASPVLRRLAEAGYLHEIGRAQYQLGPKVFQTALAYMGTVAGSVRHLRSLFLAQTQTVLDALQQITGAMPGAEAADAEDEAPLIQTGPGGQFTDSYVPTPAGELEHV